MIKKSSKKRIVWFVMGLLVLIGLFLFCDSVNNLRGKTSLFSKGEKRIVTSSSLKKIVNVSELSSLRYRYNGIATVKDKKKTIAISYKSSVTASIDMEKIIFKVDKKNKKVIITLPDAIVSANVVDQESMSFIPANSTISLKKALIACEKDADKEANESPDLIQLAIDNLKHNVEALILPLTSAEGYDIEWKSKH